MSEERFTVVAASGELLLGALPVESGRIGSRRILKAPGARIVRLTLDAGQVLREHTAAVPILIQVLAGDVRIDTDGTTLDLPSGAIMHLDAGLPHSVEALTPAHLTLTLLDGHDAVRLRHGSSAGSAHRNEPPKTGHQQPVATSGDPVEHVSPDAPSTHADSSPTNMLVFATNGADSAALTAITRHHADLSGALATDAARLLEAAASGDSEALRAARAQLVSWCHESLAPQLSAEAGALYLAAEDVPTGDELVRTLRADIEHIGDLFDRVACEEEPAALAAVTVTLRVAVARHLTTESERLLPLLAGSRIHSLASLWQGQLPQLAAVAAAH
ncbi:hemerythrin domain-containing protein [Rathayibacter soli]|uniref:hemerythrin domain-containing protein n=1 Tax=Rathayibacter soli TaxID=3144168 RepID=UPI0027E54A89|nr:hemerythrin domain-containing protein [Glaciibacter superstes]